jgi:polysaccharide export outer membrane protein
MPMKALILTGVFLPVFLACAAAQDTGPLKSGGSPTRIAGIDIEAPKSDADQPVKSLDDYQLGPGDRVTIHVVDMNEIPATPYRVDVKGAIYVPTIGRVQAQGLTEEGLAATVSERLKRVLVEPDVTVSIVEFRSQPVSILGEVGSPGVHQLEGNKTLFGMIQQAGGIRPEAGNRINITRKLKYGRIPLPNAVDDASGEFNVASVSVKDFIQGSAPQDNVPLKPEDVISVPRGEFVFVLGAVEKSGAYVINENDGVSALEILALAGGLSRSAAPQKAKVLRAVPGSTSRTETAVDLRKMLDGKSSDLQLQPNDVLMIPTSGTKSATLRTIEAAIGIGTAAATTAIYRY